MTNLKQRLNVKYFMVGYLGLLLLFSALYFNSLKIFGGGVLMVLLYSAYDLLWTFARDKVWYLPVSSWISGLVLAIVALPKPPLIILVILPLLAVSAKQLLRFGKNRHVFNPAAGALAVASLFVPVVSWWGAAAGSYMVSSVTFSSLLLFFIIGAALIILWRQNRWHITAPFFITYLFGLGIYYLNVGVDASQLLPVIYLEIFNGTIIFFATVMLIEPLTSTFLNIRQEIFYGALVGGVAVVFTYLAKTFNLVSLDPLIWSLLAGNLIASLWFLPGKSGQQKKASEISYWFRDVPAKTRYSTLTGNKQFEVVIVGGGVAGVCAAYFLAKAKVKVALLEANTLGSGDSGYTTGCATRFLDSTSATIAAWQSSDEAIKLLQEVIAKEKINCDWQNVDAVCFSRQENKQAFANFKKAGRIYKTKDAGIQFLNGMEASEAVGATVTAAFKKPWSEGIFNLRKFLMALVARAKDSGAIFYENSEAIDIQFGDKVTVKTKQGSVTAKKLIVATGIPPAKFFPKVANTLRSAVSYVIDVKFLSTPLLKQGFFWDDLAPYHYLRSLGNNEFLLGGEDWFTNEPKPVGDPYQKLTEWLKNFLGDKVKFKVVNSWQGSLFYTADTLPLIGLHPAYGKNVIFLTGWGGNGTAQGLFGANLAADLVLNKNNSWQSLFACNRKLVWPKNLSKDNNKFNFKNMPNNEGKIVEKDGKKLAVINIGDEVKTFSAICPHLGCTVGWNDEAKTWDCPCHGSRFNADGSLLRGPAQRGLDSPTVK